MTTFNRLGFVVIEDGGHLVQDSMLSAHSHKRVSPGGVLEAVPGTDGLFVRLLPREARQLNKRERQAIHDAATAWYRQEHAPATTDSAPPESEPGVVPFDEMTLEQLQDLAREVNLPGRSKLSKDDLAAALQDYLVAPDDPDEE